jgi:alkylhydroperoxidase family enzyme
MYLPSIQSTPLSGPLGERITQMQAAGLPIPEIWHLFRFKPEATRHLAEFTQAVMRGPSPLAPGWRELIAAFTSRRNDCLF